MFKKSILHTVIAVILLISIVLSGCSYQSPTGTVSKGNPIKETQEPKEKGPYTLSITMPQDVLVEDYEMNAFTKHIEENCNIDIKFNFLPADTAEAKNKLTLILSSGEKLTDVINMNLSETEAFAYGQDGIFLDLTEYYKTAVNIQKANNAYPQYNIVKNSMGPDGKTYFVPWLAKEEIGLAPQKAWICQKFLDELSMKAPTNTQELYDFAKAIKKNDPNKNGSQDEIPIVGKKDSAAHWLMNAFIYYDTGNHYIVKDEVVDVAYRQEEYREGLKYMHMLCKESLFSPLSFTMDLNQLKQLTDSDGQHHVVGIAFTFATSMLLNNYKENPFTKDYVGLAPITGPNGVRTTSYAEPSVVPRWFITKDCKNPKLAFDVADFMWSEESYCLGRFGVKGVDWNSIDPAEKKQANIAGFVALINQPNSNWNKPQNSHWRTGCPTFSYDFLDSRLFDGNKLNPTYTAGLISQEYNKVLPPKGTFISNLKFMTEELNEINEIQATLKTYSEESLARFVTGDLNIESDWDNYIKELEKIGLKKFLEVSQAAWDRMNK